MEDYKWIFSGIGVAILGGLFTLLLTLIGRKKKKVTIVIKITTPKQDDVIKVDVYNDMKGTFEGDIPTGYKLWVLAQDQFNYFLMYPPPATQVTRTMGTWSQTNVRLAAAGIWKLHVCLANANASQKFEDRAKLNDWSGFPVLPDGMETIRYVVVERIDQSAQQDRPSESRH